MDCHVFPNNPVLIYTVQSVNLEPPYAQFNAIYKCDIVAFELFQVSNVMYKYDSNMILERFLFYQNYKN